MRKLSVIVPETVENYEMVADGLSVALAAAFGGFNQYEGNGGWLDDSGTMIKEKHIRVEAYGKLSDITAEQRNDMLLALHSVLDNQDCIFVEYGDKAQLLYNLFDALSFLSSRNL